VLERRAGASSSPTIDMLSSMSVALRARHAGARTLCNFAFKSGFPMDINLGAESASKAANCLSSKTRIPSTSFTSKETVGEFLSSLEHPSYSFEREAFGSASSNRGTAQLSAMSPVASLESALDAMMFEAVAPKAFAQNSFGSKMLMLPQAPEERKDFNATHEWQLLPKNVICPAGLQYKVDLSTNTTLARLHSTE